MRRYIEANALITALRENCSTVYQGDAWYGKEPMLYKDDVKQCIEEAPTADVVEIVRCKDCIHSRTANFFRGFGCWLTLDGYGNPRIINDGDGYCWRGEKK